MQLHAIVLMLMSTTVVNGVKLLRRLPNMALLRSGMALHSSHSSSTTFVDTILNSENEIEALGSSIGKALEVGDVLFLTGDLGAGKTTLARGIIRQKCGDETMRVTSPTYLLDNTYEYDHNGNVEVLHHIDLYRLPKDCDLGFLSIPSIFDRTICLIEWPERLNNKYLPQSYITVDITLKKDSHHQSRRVVVGCHGARCVTRMDNLSSLPK